MTRTFLSRRGAESTEKSLVLSVVWPVLALLVEPACVNAVPYQPPEPLTKELLLYWLQHAEKFGTVESIVEWWLLEHRIQQAAAEVRVVLEQLVARGFVVQWQEADRRIYYQLNPDKEAEARAWLESGEGADSCCAAVALRRRKGQR